MRIFLTGATGLLGGELLLELASRPEVERIHVLVRPRAGESGAARLKAIFDVRGDPFDPDKIVAVEGDLLDASLGGRLLADPALGRVEVVLHAAANTSFLRMNQALVEETNVHALERLLTWARGLPSLQTFLYVGTAMICGTRPRAVPIDEDESPSADAVHLVGYTSSKMRAELLLRRSLPADRLLIARPSILMGDSRAVAPRSVVVLWAMAAINRLRLMPVDAAAALDIVPVDHAARAICALLFARRRHDVYHVSAGARGVTSAGRLAELLARHFSALPPFCFVRGALLHELRRWVKGRPPSASSELRGHGRYLDYWKDSFGEPRKVLAVLGALEPYLRFMELGHVFAADRLLDATGLAGAEPAHVYMERSMRHLAAIDVVRGTRDP